VQRIQSIKHVKMKTIKLERLDARQKAEIMILGSAGLNQKDPAAQEIRPQHLFRQQLRFQISPAIKFV